MVIHGGRSVEQHCKQVLLDVAYLGGVLLQTVHDKLDVGAVQFKKTGTHDLVRKVCPRDRVVFRLAQTVSTNSSTISFRSSR